MEFIKDIYEAWGARIKSNVFGSVAIAFILVNWKVLYFLSFADVPVEMKFNYFDANTNWISIYLLPILIGVILALGLPFINDLAHGVVSKPISRVRSRDDEYAHERLKKKNEWEAERNRSLELLVEKAEIEERAENIKDEDRREEIQEKLAHLNAGEIHEAALKELYARKVSRLSHLDDEVSDLKAELKARERNQTFTIGSSLEDDVGLEKRNRIDFLLNEKASLELDIGEIREKLKSFNSHD